MKQPQYTLVATISSTLTDEGALKKLAALNKLFGAMGMPEIPSTVSSDAELSFSAKHELSPEEETDVQNHLMEKLQTLFPEYVVEKKSFRRRGEGELLTEEDFASADGSFPMSRSPFGASGQDVALSN